MCVCVCVCVGRGGSSFTLLLSFYMTGSNNHAMFSGCLKPTGSPLKHTAVVSSRVIRGSELQTDS